MLKPPWAQEEESKLGFPLVNHGDYAAALNDESMPNVERQSIAQGTYKKVWHKPAFGLLKQNTYVPTAYAPLTFEFSLQNGTEWCDTGNTDVGGVAVANSTTYELKTCTSTMIF